MRLGQTFFLTLALNKKRLYHDGRADAQLSAHVDGGVRRRAGASRLVNYPSEITIPKTMFNMTKYSYDFQRTSRNIKCERNKISFLNLNHPNTVLDFIRQIKSVLKQGENKIELDFSQVATFFPNVVAPISGIIDYYTGRGITFVVPDIQDHLRAMGLISPIVFESHKDEHHVLNKIWKFRGPDVGLLVDKCINELQKSDTFDPGVLNTLEWSLNEVMDNVIQHSLVDEGIMIGQIHPASTKIAFTVFDVGQGIFNSFKGSNYAPRTPVDAITLAMQEEVTRDKEIGQGNGLFGLHSIIVQGEGRLVITSGGALFNLFEGKIKTAGNLPVLTREQTSTTIDFQLDYSKKLSIDKALKFKGKPYDITSLRIENLENEKGVIHYKIAEQGDGTGTRMAAERIKNELLNILTEEVRPIILDFSGVTVISSSFADELIAKLLSRLGLYQFNKIFRLEGLNDSQQLILHRSVLQRLAQEYQKISTNNTL